MRTVMGLVATDLFCLVLSLAASFFREILERYSVVFVGYSADDPPVQYLLEALNKTDGRMKGVYAFQSGDENYANSKWQHCQLCALRLYYMSPQSRNKTFSAILKLYTWELDQSDRRTARVKPSGR